MSLTATPVTAADLQNLQKGILRHTNPTEAAAEAALINAGATTVAAYETSLMAQAQAFTVDAEAVLEVFTGQTGTSAELDNLVNNFLPAQNAYAIAHGFNTTVFDAESLGLGLSAGTAFATNFGPANAALPNTVAGDALAAGSIANAVFGSGNTPNLVNQVTQWIANWKAIYTQYGLPGNAHPTADQIDTAARGAAAGDAVGQAVLNNIGPLGAQAQNVLVNDALFENGQAATAYGVTPATVPSAPALQGGTQTTNVFTLTAGVDTFTAIGANAQFNAPAVSSPLGGLQNSLNTSDNLQDAFGDGVLNVTEVGTSFIGGNPPTALGVTMNGISTANITNLSGKGAGFSGTITGLTTVSTSAANNGSTTLGIAGQGLNTALKTLNLNANQTFTAFIADAALAGAADAVTVNYTGPQANTLALVNDGTGKGANGYESLTINAAGTTTTNVNLGGVTTLKSLVLGGAGAITLADTFSTADFSKVTSIDATANTGGVTITGAETVNGLLTANTVLTKILGGAGNDFFDLTGYTKAQIQAMTINGGAGANRVAILSSIADSATLTPLTNLTNEQTVDLAGPLAGTLNDANFVGVTQFNMVSTTGGSTSSLSADLAVTNAVNGLTFNFNNSDLGNHNFTITDASTTSTTDAVTLGVGNITNGGGTVTTNGFGTVNVVNSGADGTTATFANAGLIGNANPGGGITLNFSGAENLFVGTGTIVVGTPTVVTQHGVIHDTMGGFLDIGVTDAVLIDASGATAGPAFLEGLFMAGPDSSLNITVKTGAGGLNEVQGSMTTAVADVAGPGDLVTAGSDAFTLNGVGDIVYGDGGKDSVTIAGGHGDQVVIGEFHIGSSFGSPGSNIILEVTNNAGLFVNGFGTAAGVTTITGFTAGGATHDAVDFRAGAWGHSATYDGLVTGNDTQVTAGATAIQTVTSSGVLINAPTNVVADGITTYANAAALAADLAGANGVVFSAAHTHASDMLFAYSDGTNTHIADVSFAAATTNTSGTLVTAHDIAVLTGVALTSVVNADIHFV